MYKLYIVDDETRVRKGLQRHFDWAKFNIEVVGEASNGEQAFEILRQQPVDILVTDVKMPKMDGIELAFRLRELYPEIKIIFISGHDDLDFLKSSLKLGAIDYILKSINLNELEETICRVVGMIDTERQKTKLLRQMENKVRQSMPLLRDKFLVQLLRDPNENESRLNERLDFLGLHLQEGSGFCIMVISVENYYEVFSGKQERDRQLVSFAILNIFQELLERHFAGYCFEMRQGEYSAILMLREEGVFETELLALVAEVRELLIQHLNIYVTVGVSQVTDTLAEINVCYNEAIKAIRNKTYLGTETTVAIEGSRRQAENFRLAAKFKKLIEQVALGDTEVLISLLQETFQAVEMQDEAIQWDLCFSLIFFAIPELEEYRDSVDEEFASPRLVCERLLCLKTTERMHRLVEQFYIAYSEAARKKRNNPFSAVISQIKNCIHARFAENLTVSTIAGEVYLTPTYICLLFKQETGMTINDYLTEVRIKKAKEFLQEPQMKLYDICFAVGYTSPSYFSRLFKKHTGYTPSEYRDMTVGTDHAAEPATI